MAIHTIQDAIRWAGVAAEYLSWDAERGRDPKIINLYGAKDFLRLAMEVVNRQISDLSGPLRGAVATELLHDLAPDAQIVLDRAEIDWDGNNHVGKLDEIGAAASARMEKIIAQYGGDGDEIYSVDADECFDADGRCMIWLHDDATLLDVYGIVTGYPRFVVDFHPTTEDIYGENDEAEGFLSTTVATWENVLQLVTILLKES